MDVFDLNEFFTFSFRDGQIKLSPEEGQDIKKFALSRLSLVRIAVPTTPVNKVVRSKKVTFSSQLANIGI